MAKTFTLNSKFAFGKYRGKRLRIVMEKDPNYVVWCLENVDWFELDPEARRRLDSKLTEKAPGKNNEDYLWRSNEGIS